MRAIPEETSGLIENILAGAFFWLPNLLLFFPIFRDALSWVLALYNFVIIFILISVMSHFRFSMRYLKETDDKTNYSQSGKMLKGLFESISKSKKRKK